MQITERGRLANAGFYGLNEMKAIFKTKLIDSYEDYITLQEFKQGLFFIIKQYLQVESSVQG